jgi:hypothetical protein
MSVKVVDLMEDLEGCVGAEEIEKRSNENLKGGTAETPESFLRDANRLIEQFSGLGTTTGTFGGLASGLQQSQGSLNQWHNQQMMNANLAMQNVTVRKGFFSGGL